MQILMLVMLLLCFEAIAAAKEIEPVLIFKGDKVMMFNPFKDAKLQPSARPPAKFITSIETMQSPLKELGAPDAACSFGADMYFFYGIVYWTANDRSYEAAGNPKFIFSLFNATNPQLPVNAAYCYEEIDEETKEIIQAAYFIKEDTIEKLTRPKNSPPDTVFQPVKSVKIAITPDAAFAPKHLNDSLFFIPVLISGDTVYLFDFDYPSDLRAQIKIAKIFDLSTEDEKFFASDLKAVMSVFPFA